MKSRFTLFLLMLALVGTLPMGATEL